MRAEKAGDDIDRRARAPSRRAARSIRISVVAVEAVARLDLDGGDALRQQRDRAAAGVARTRSSSLAARVALHGRDDAAACARNVFVGRAGKPQLELVRAIARIDEMRVAIDQPRRDPAAVESERAWRHPSRPAARPPARQRRCGRLGGDRATLDDPEPGRPGARVAKPRIEPDRIEPHASSSCRAGCPLYMNASARLLSTVSQCPERRACERQIGAMRCHASCFSTTRCCRRAGRATFGMTVADGTISRSRPARSRDGAEHIAGHRRSRPAQSALPRLPARHGRACRAARAGSRQLLDLARGDVPVPRPALPRRRRGDHRLRLYGNAGSGLYRGRRIPLSASRCRWPALCRHRRDGGAHRRRERRDAASA